MMSFLFGAGDLGVVQLTPEHYRVWEPWTAREGYGAVVRHARRLEAWERLPERAYQRLCEEREQRT